MLDYQLKIDAGGNVRYLMKQDGANVAGKMAFEKALKLLSKGTPMVTEEFEAFPVTADGVFYFDAMYRVTEG